ncbi:MAG: ATP-dependent helicase HrpB, partial [Deltaproteobacteria bacterium]
TVVDSGWAKTVRFNPNTGLSRLVPVQITKASAEQRAGRAGRLSPGCCYRLWDEYQQQGMKDHPEPEILEADLAPLALELANWGVGPDALAWLNPPPAKHYLQAQGLLHTLGALDSNNRVTAAGRRMTELPVHPRLAHMLLASEKLGLANLACLLAALLEERDVLHYRPGGQSVDLGYRLHVLEAFLAGNRGEVQQFGGDPALLERVVNAARRLAEVVVGRAGKKAPLQERAGARLLSFAYPDRIAMLRENSRTRYLLANGRGVALAEADLLAGSPFLAAARLDAGQVEGRLHLAARLEEEDLLFDHRDRIGRDQSVSWDEQRQAVSAVEELRLESLVLKRRPLAKADPEKITAVLLAKIRDSDLTLLPWSERTRQLQARVICLAAWLPTEDWPAMEDEDLTASLEQWLQPYVEGICSAAQLHRLDLYSILRNKLSWHQQQRLEALAPEQFTVPSGSRKKLRYSAGEPPVLAVRLQEMFGLGDTPRICNGKIAVILHLLSPAQRPLQVTGDLKGFWDRTYPEIKKELKGRYPRHHWPDDPWEAQPTARAKSRK